MEKNFRKYSLFILFTMDIGEVEVNKEIELVKNILISLDCKIENSTNLKLKKLAYPIKKKQFAHFTHFYFMMEDTMANGKRIQEMFRQFNLKTSIIRYLLSKTNDIKNNDYINHLNKVTSFE